MAMDYWWAHRNNRRACKMPDINAPFDPEVNILPGTPETRLAACLAHTHRNMALAKIRAENKRAWLALQSGI